MGLLIPMGLWCLSCLLLLLVTSVLVPPGFLVFLAGFCLVGASASVRATRKPKTPSGLQNGPIGKSSCGGVAYGGWGAIFWRWPAATGQNPPPPPEGSTYRTAQTETRPEKPAFGFLKTGL